MHDSENGKNGWWYFGAKSTVVVAQCQSLFLINAFVCVFKYRFRERGVLKHELVPFSDGAPGRRALSFTHVFLTAADIARPVLSH